MRTVDEAARSVPSAGTFPLFACLGYSAALVALSVLPTSPLAVPDTLAHAGAYGVHAVFLWRVGSRLFSPLGTLLAGCVGATAFGGLTEVLQHFVPPRTAELKDLLAAMAGAGTVLVAVLALRRLLGAVRTGFRGPPSRAFAALPREADHQVAGETTGRRSESMTTETRQQAGESPEGSTCIHCLEPIHRGASRCARCQAWQSRWAAESQNPRLEMALLAAGVAIVAVLCVWLTLRDGERARQVSRGFIPGALSVTQATPSPFPSTARPALAVVGTMRNRSSVTWRDPYLNVRCFDRQGRAFDAFTARLSGLVVPAGRETVFRVVESQLLRDPAEYARCDVEVRWAQRAD